MHEDRAYGRREAASSQQPAIAAPATAASFQQDLTTFETLRHPPAAMDIDALHRLRVGLLDRLSGEVFAFASNYPNGHHVPPHRHNRSQLLHALSGVATVATSQGRWMAPAEHAFWIPAGVTHSVEMLGDVRMSSLYVATDAIAGLPDRCRVVGMTDLMRSLLVEAATLPLDYVAESRAALVMALILDEIPRLPEKPLGLPFPGDPRLAELCRRFVEAPSPRAPVDDWADALAMSRRSFTRAFRQETGVSLSTWRQQCCVFAALPRLARGEPVTSVALDLGYDSVPAFTTMFKRMLGASPRHYFGEKQEMTGRARPL